LLYGVTPFLLEGFYKTTFWVDHHHHQPVIVAQLFEEKTEVGQKFTKCPEKKKQTVQVG